MTLPAPMLASPADLEDVGVYIVDDTWALEQKLDGHRVRWHLTTGRFLNRNGDPYTKQIPQALRDFTMPGGVVLDGELVGGVYYVFDIMMEVNNLHMHPLSERRLVLESMIASIKSRYPDLPLEIVPQAVTPEDKRRLVERVIQENLEGVVAKKLSTIYYPTRSAWWLKIKVTVTADVVVMDVRDDGKESARLGIYQGGRLVEIGRCSLIGKPPIEVGEVVEVKYLYVTEEGRLYQPTLMRVRFDKEASSCDGSDFRVVNKTVLTSIRE